MKVLPCAFLLSSFLLVLHSPAATELPDITSKNRPMVFWINDDNDSNEEDHPGSPIQDCADNEISSLRDLEDFERLHISIGGLHEAIANGSIQVGLEWRDITSGPPSIKIYRAAEPDGGRKYLTNENSEYAAVLQTTALFKTALGTIDSGGGFKFPLDFWQSTTSGIPAFDEDHPTRGLLFEGVTEGKGQLVFTFWKDNQKIGEGGGVWLDLKNVKNLYQRGIAQPEGIAAPHASPNGPFNGPTNVLDDQGVWPFEKDPREEKNAIIFVHGWSMDYPTYSNFTETLFKRLRRQGFKGRMCSFRWDPLVANQAQLYAGEYNRSEHRAFVYGQALKQFVESIKNEGLSVTLIGHSMGNIVCSSALQQGLSVKNYLLMEAAVPAGCYDTGGGKGLGGVNGYSPFWDAEVNSPTPDYHNTDKGYRGSFQRIDGNTKRMVNFHNHLDYALATGTKFGFFQANWEKNQIDYKPDGSGMAIHASDWRYLYNTNETDLTKKGRLENIYFINSSPIWALTRYVNDSYETKAFIARPRSKAVGAVDANKPSNIQHVNLQDYGFDGRESDHSGQFNRRIQEVDKLYKDIITILNAQ